MAPAYPRGNGTESVARHKAWFECHSLDHQKSIGVTEGREDEGPG